MTGGRRRHASFGPVAVEPDAGLPEEAAASIETRQRRAAAAGVLAACLLGAVGLHAVTLYGAGRVLSAESIGRRIVIERPPPVRVVARLAIRPQEPVPAGSPKQREAVSPSSPAPPMATAISAPPRTGPSTQVPPDAGAGGPGYRFYDAREVDVTAEPVLQWNLDPAALDSLATSRIVFTLFVGSDGTVLHCSVDEPERLAPEQRKALATRIAATAMRPARRAGLPVPSRRRVELFTVGGV